MPFCIYKIPYPKDDMMVVKLSLLVLMQNFNPMRDFFL